MATVQDHPHSFPPDSWPFSEPVNTLAYASMQVLRDGYPVLLVFHDHDGEWQFLHGAVNEQDEGDIVCLGCAYERDNTLGILADLPIGSKAYRESTESSWQCEPYEDSDADEG
jgi:hypothetical protein